MAVSEKEFFGPLTLHEKNEKPSIFKSVESEECQCVLCEEKFCLPASEKQLLTHLFMDHRLVISDVNQIADLGAYLKYWRLRFRDQCLAFFCTTMLLDSKPDGTKSMNEEYFLLSDVLPEDKELRMNLQQTKLEKLLERHQFEREDTHYEMDCLFCKFTSVGTRADYLKHLYEKHNFHIARPDNLIFIDELINMIASKLENLRCIFCEGKFKERAVLKEHMRKKGHKRINPDNKEYDKFYLVNYTGETVKQKSNIKSYKTNKVKPPIEKAYEYEQDSNIDSDPEWSEWTEENGPLITCLLCQHSEMEYEDITEHMLTQHEFAFSKITEGFSFYEKIKIVNYIRRQIHLKQCLVCELKFGDSKNLEKHVKEMKHWNISKGKWDQPEYYFPTYEDDLFLCFIEDEDESWWSGDEQEMERRNSMSDNISKEMAMAVLND